MASALMSVNLPAQAGFGEPLLPQTCLVVLAVEF
jgi:hypothetical protein